MLDGRETPCEQGYMDIAVGQGAVYVLLSNTLRSS